MPGRFAFTSPGAAAVEELTRVLAEREAKRRQDFMDSITMKRENRNDEIQRAQLDSITEQRDVMNQQRKQMTAASLTKMIAPTQDLDPETTDILKQGGLGILVRPSGPTATGETEETVNTTDVFRGTPDQLKAQQDEQRRSEYLSTLDPESIEAKTLAYEEATGKNPPAGMLNPPTERAKTAMVQEYELSKVDPEFEAYQTRDANRKRPPAPQLTDTGFTSKQEVRFNGLARERASSPLMKAADRTIVLANAAKAIERNPTDPSNQLALAYSWIQALDTYQSAVREGELQLMGGLATRWQNLLMEANKVANEGAVMPPETAKMIAANANELIKTIESGRMLKEREFAARAKVSGVEEMWNQFMTESQQSPSAEPVAPGASAVVKWGKGPDGKPMRLP